MQEVFYPNDLKYANAVLPIELGRLKNSFQNANYNKVFSHLTVLIDKLKFDIEIAKKENIATRKRKLVDVRLEALIWYNLDHIEDNSCNMFLYKIKNELKWYIDETERLYNLSDSEETKEPIAAQPITENIDLEEPENDVTLSTIEEWLFEFKEKMSEADYQTLVFALKQYLNSGQFPTLKKKIQVNGRPNKKRVGWVLNRIFEAHGKGVEKELLLFAKQNISLFTDVAFDENDMRKSNLYKYFTTQTK